MARAVAKHKRRQHTLVGMGNRDSGALRNAKHLAEMRKRYTQTYSPLNVAQAASQVTAHPGGRVGEIPGLLNHQGARVRGFESQSRP